MRSNITIHYHLSPIITRLFYVITLILAMVRLRVSGKARVNLKTEYLISRTTCCFGALPRISLTVCREDGSFLLNLLTFLIYGFLSKRRDLR